MKTGILADSQNPDMKTFDLAAVEHVVKTIAHTAIENEKYFCDLDAAAGDADFGTSLATGFKEVLAQWDTYDRSSINAFLLKVSMVITRHVGGSSGPLWGTAFMRAGISAKEKELLTYQDIAEMIHKAVDGIMQRGGAKEGDKTLIDGLLPIARTLEEHRAIEDEQEMLNLLVKITEDTKENTKDWVAKYGRQSFTGERSAGTYDPGIAAIATITQAISEKTN